MNISNQWDVWYVPLRILRKPKNFKPSFPLLLKHPLAQQTLILMAILWNKLVTIPLRHQNYHYWPVFSHLLFQSLTHHISSIPKHDYYYYLITACTRVILEKLTGFQIVEKFPHFMEPENSLPHSQVPARSSPYPHPPSFWRSILYYLPSTPGSTKWTLCLRFSHQNLVYASVLLLLLLLLNATPNIYNNDEVLIEV